MSVPEIEISLDDVMDQMSERGKREWDLAMKKAEIKAIEENLDRDS